MGFAVAAGDGSGKGIDMGVQSLCQKALLKWQKRQPHASRGAVWLTFVANFG